MSGAVTTTKAFDVLRRNFIIANYNSLGAVDNDDGSSYYISEENFFVYGGGGLKNDFEVRSPLPLSSRYATAWHASSRARALSHSFLAPGVFFPLPLSRATTTSG